MQEKNERQKLNGKNWTVKNCVTKILQQKTLGIDIKETRMRKSLVKIVEISLVCDQNGDKSSHSCSMRLKGCFS